MKRFYLSLAVFLLLLTTCGYSLFRTWDTRDELLTQTDEILHMVEQGSSDDLIMQRCVELTRYWEEKEGVMVRYIRHAHLDEITSAVARLPDLSRQDDQAELRAELSVVRTVIDRVWDAELPLFRNIL